MSSIFVYADDLIMPSGSVLQLQRMIDVCMIDVCMIDVCWDQYKNLDLRINVNKSVCKNWSGS